MGWDTAVPTDGDKGKFFPAIHRADKTTLENAWNKEHEALGGASWVHKDNFLTVAMLSVAVAELIETAGGTLPSGTRMIFDQDAAPTGWTRDEATVNDKVIRIVTGARADGGSWTVSGLTVNAHTHTGPSHTHPIGAHIHAIGNHQHQETVGALTGSIATLKQAAPFGYGSAVAGWYYNEGYGYTGATYNRQLTSDPVSGSTGSSSGDTSSGGTGATGSASPGITSAGTWRPLHRDMILCVKD